VITNISNAAQNISFPEIRETKPILSEHVALLDRKQDTSVCESDRGGVCSKCFICNYKNSLLQSAKIIFLVVYFNQ
jgi:hypothetical protein